LIIAHIVKTPSLRDTNVRRQLFQDGFVGRGNGFVPCG
jgi:hypothetical protein